MFDFVFYIYTSVYKSICYRQPIYRVHEAIFTTVYISQLKTNGWVCKCEEHWDAALLLAAKRHQETYYDIEDFFEDHLLVITSLTLLLNPPNSIEDLRYSYIHLFLILLHTRLGYHRLKYANMIKKVQHFFLRVKRNIFLPLILNQRTHLIFIPR